MFPCEFCGICKNIFFTEHLWGTASIVCCESKKTLPTFTYVSINDFDRVNARWANRYNCLTEDKTDSFSSSGYNAGTIPDVNMLLINSKKPVNIN